MYDLSLVSILQVIKSLLPGIHIAVGKFGVDAIP